MMNSHINFKTNPLRLYNTVTRQKEFFAPLSDDHVRMYTCGPTVYHYAHIGNFRTYVFEDLLRRTLKFFGMQVTQVMNLTDVDDKTIRGAIAKGITLDAFTQPYKDAFFEDIKTLNIEPAEHYPAATDYIPQMIQMIQVLLDNGVAYQGGDGSIYYAIKKFPHYGCLSHLHLEELQVGASERVAADEYEKDNVSDFVLWKKYDPTRDGKIFWESPFGQGRPGWHLECSAMAIALLGETIDIHVGAVDNIFPHHENEIAQSEACTGKKFSNVWMHSEHLVVDHKKMSKSLGNFYTLRDLLDKGFIGPHVRYMLLQTHYKTQLNFTFVGLEASKGSLKRLNDFIQRLLTIDQVNDSNVVAPLIQKAYKGFAEALADDLNISVALGSLFELVREGNALCDGGLIGQREAQEVIALLKQFDSVLGVLTFDKAIDEIPADLKEALTRRLQARKEKNWALSDQMRDLIMARGYLIEDTQQGPRLKKVN
jgi:cysteinyl-tRNA synthetase